MPMTYKVGMVLETKNRNAQVFGSVVQWLVINVQSGAGHVHLSQIKGPSLGRINRFSIININHAIKRGTIVVRKDKK